MTDTDEQHDREDEPLVPDGPAAATAAGPSRTPLPVLKVLSLASALLCNTFMSTMLLPFLTFMVDDFDIAPRPEDIGKYSGYLVSSFMVGQLLFTYSWGYMSDKFGRRPIIIAGMLLTGTSFLTFGFSTSYWMAMVCRFVNGAVNGIVGVTMTCMSEITDETNQGSGFAILGTSRAAGIVLGPIVGGFLSQPAKKYPTLFPKDSLFDRFPYALPSVVGFLFAMSGGIMAIFVLQETRTFKKQESVSPDIESSNERSSVSTCSDQVRSSCSAVDDSDSCDGDMETEQSPLLGPTSSNRVDDGPESIWVLLKSPSVSLSILLYSVLNATYIQYDEVFALWSRLAPVDGGLGFQSEDQGITLTVGGACLFLYQLLIYSSVERRCGTLLTFRLGVLMTLPSFVLLPLATNFASTSRWAMWGLVCAAQILRTSCGLQAFTSTFVMMSNSCTSRSRGSLNGFGQMLGALGRMVGPIVAGNLFSWSLQNGLSAPLDYHLMFVVLVIQQLATYAISLWVPVSINHRLRDDDEAEEAAIRARSVGRGGSTPPR
ncbi:hypothetical protein HK105_205549 [Polyrhizophydium stewartii]|uniref:Major facilitator superfamily (MFS) profile domain-containing protein n=1 Tax=Polyrhizophydium stewartii TaxID=2732419 RepID=A0ABR4N6C3_9FUNG